MAMNPFSQEREDRDALIGAMGAVPRRKTPLPQLTPTPQPQQPVSRPQPAPTPRGSFVDPVRAGQSLTPQSSYSGPVSTPEPRERERPSPADARERFSAPGGRTMGDPYEPPELPDAGATAPDAATETTAGRLARKDHADFTALDQRQLGTATQAEDGATQIGGSAGRTDLKTPAEMTGGAEGTSYFDSLLNTEIDPTRPGGEYEGGDHAPRANQLTGNMAAGIRGNYGLNPEKLGEDDINELVEMGWTYGQRAPDGYEYNDLGQLEKQGSVWKTIGRVAAIAAPVIATIATGGAASPWLMGAIGAGAGATNAALSGAGAGGILTGAALGGATSGFAAGGAGVLPSAALGAAGSALTGGNPLVGAVSGAAQSSLAAGGRPTITDSLTDAGMAGAGLLAAGMMGSPDLEDMDPETRAAVLEQLASEDAAPTETEPEMPAVDSATPEASGPLGAPAGPMEGFNLDRAQDPSFSIKDAFAAAVRTPGIPPPPGEDKAALGEWFSQYVQPSIEAQGHTVNWVDGDKINVTGPQGTGTVDWYRGAGAPGGALAWQAEDGSGAGGPAGDAPGDLQSAYQAFASSGIDPNLSRGEMQSVIEQYFGNVPGYEEAYKESVKINGQWWDLVANYEGPNATFQLMKKDDGGSRGGATAARAGGGGLGLAAQGPQLAPILQDEGINAEIMAEIQRLMRGEPPRDALLNAMGG